MVRPLQFVCELVSKGGVGWPKTVGVCYACVCRVPCVFQPCRCTKANTLRVLENNLQFERCALKSVSLWKRNVQCLSVISYCCYCVTEVLLCTGSPLAVVVLCGHFEVYSISFHILKTALLMAPVTGHKLREPCMFCYDEVNFSIKRVCLFALLGFKCCLCVI